MLNDVGFYERTNNKVAAPEVEGSCGRDFHKAQIMYKAKNNLLPGNVQNAHISPPFTCTAYMIRRFICVTKMFTCSRQVIKLTVKSCMFYSQALKLVNCSQTR